MKLGSILISALVVGSAIVIQAPAYGDAVTARCDIYPQGDDRATYSGQCSFSQRQGVVAIKLASGQHYDLVPVGDRPGHYLDQNQKPAYRQAGLGDRGQIYRLEKVSIFVYWDAAPYTPANPQSLPK
ncbi:hypothetical protein RIF25_04355 [Thermosynechococcaceae cyanobacterium BACA0444]|uniref:Uncharacterized protein n=1 Tax=Pseudocalidococcus azoricus BACA0444 TaxID=2918990 RepID=A0AAE4FSA3_9CYAN|nr:hypothetical protein [Pseudocalidococcus azoricus]MDS3860035.1 hypothetical protein [Pseudocalidococcus azoricus BACA0444]